MGKIQAAVPIAVLILAACTVAPPSETPADSNPSPAAPARPPAASTPGTPRAAPVPAPPPGGGFPRTLQPAKWSDLPGWNEDDQAAAWPAFIASCRGVASKPHGPGWKRVCDLARAADGKPGHDPRRFFESQLKPYAIQASDGNATGLVTGYYEPLLRGSRTRVKGFE